MKKLVRHLNNLLISLVLAVFYLIIVGISAFIFRVLFLLKSPKAHTTYWQDAKGNAQDVKYFESAY